ncbi:hypothetical protein AK812_SmicGene42673 [Symbiodinium microadriaticum]|uniref:Uncharacterized protein n=1 Tax=Symbiodinium microadriaticum TaxID=2951 RepID=A0A1Q9C2X7_SYMMI|nr:hypothetical protein AK812_SmicGene42673 [Symbiodinium microadriaticum]CAE7877949.1 unnamed protein product [Symbiodinium microadriaticum]CAE7949052.1 unnamed protein product [Symbiodinium sp. KB8]
MPFCDFRWALLVGFVAVPEWLDSPGGFGCVTWCANWKMSRCGLMCELVHAKEPELQQESPSAESSSSAAPVQDSDASCYDTMRTQLQQKVLGDLQNLFGLSDAYQVLAVAMTMIDRFQEQKVKFASEACARSLASFAFTCSGVVDEDIKRRQYLDHLVSTHVMSVKDMRTKECWWAMLLPSKGA